MDPASWLVGLALIAARPGGEEDARVERTPEELRTEAREAASAAQQLAVRAADSFDARGSARFQKGDFRGAIEDFDAAIELDPRREPWHWRRGIAYYYAGEFEKGAKQFEAYQTVDADDVENVVWRYLCVARRRGIDEARRTLLPVGEDRRVPMRAIYDLFAGRAEPRDVLETAKAGNPPADALDQRLFYAHLYIGLYHEAHERKDLARTHVATAAHEHRVGHYMWHVARVHSELYEHADARDKTPRAAVPPVDPKGPPPPR